MFLKVKRFIKSKVRKSMNDEVQTSLFQFLQDKDQKKVIYCSSFNLCYHGNGNFSATSDDPSLIFQLPYGQSELSFLLQIQSKNMDCLSAVYYSFDKNQNFSEKNKLVIGKVNGQLHKRHLIFPAPIYWLRVDPVDHTEDFTISQIGIHAIVDDTTVSDWEVIEAYQELSAKEASQLISKNILGQAWQADQVVIFVSHEISGTGAPLLCRKMSAEARRLGMHTVILSLLATTDSQTVRQFSNDCDVLLICQQNEDINIFLKELAGLGCKSAILNSVATGTVLRQFHDAGFKTVCLIHEMNSALQILNAQKWIKDYSKYAYKVIFPANCVKEEFIRFGGEVDGKAIVMPQGYYKSKKPESSSFSRIDLMKKLGIPDGSKLIIGAGSINFLKGVDLLPLIVCELRRIDTVDYHFIWLGESNDMQYDVGLQNQITRMNIENKFHFLGYVADENYYLNLFSICDTLVLVSREDSYPSVLIEAMACEIPVVAFKGSGGAEDLLADGRGYLINYMDIPQYAQALHCICNEPSFADDVKHCAKEYIQSHGNFEQYVKNVLGLFA